MANVPPPLIDWLHAFAEAVRCIDYERGRALFEPDAVGFGTRVDEADGLDPLIVMQWRVIWSRTEGFQFVENSIRGGISSDSRLAWILSLWESRERAVDAAPGAVRRGRATLLLRRSDSSGSWRAFHSHFSRLPSETHAVESGWTELRA